MTKKAKQDEKIAKMKVADSDDSGGCNSEASAVQMVPVHKKKQMEEDLQGYMDWLTVADDLEAVRAAESGGASLKVDVGKHKGDPVVMGLLKSTMFPLQQVLEGNAQQGVFLHNF